MVLRCGFKMPLDFMSSLWIFIPKASPEDGLCEDDLVVRPGETRPLALKNLDNKLCCSVWLRRLRSAVSERLACSEGLCPDSTHLAECARS